MNQPTQGRGQSGCVLFLYPDLKARLQLKSSLGIDGVLGTGTAVQMPKIPETPKETSWAKSTPKDENVL